jgi:ABC-2 type transport system permease protein
MNSILIGKNIVMRAIGNKRELMALIILPIIVMLIITFVIGQFDQQEIEVSILNQDKKELSQKFVQYIREQKNIKVISIEHQEYQKLLQDNGINVGIVIPENFSEAIKKGEKIELDIIEDGRSPEGESIKGIINDYIFSLYSIRETIVETDNFNGEIETDVLLSFIDDFQNDSLAIEFSIIDNELKKSEFEGLLSVLGFGIIFLMIMSLNTMGTIMEDKKRLTLARMYATPVREGEVIFGNLLGGFVLGIIQLIPMIVTIKYVFNIPWGLELFYLFIILLMFIISTIGLGIGISGIIKNGINPTMLIATIIVPSCVIGGVFIPESMMPEIMSKIGYIVPQKWVMKAIGEVFQGGSFKSIVLDLGIILLFGLTFSTFGIKTLKPIDE